MLEEPEASHEPWEHPSVAPEHPYTNDDLTDRVRGELRSTATQLIEMFPRLIAATTLTLLMKGQTQRAEHQLYMQGKGNPSLLAELQRAALLLEASCERVRSVLDAENNAGRDNPTWDDLVAGGRGEINPDDAPTAL